MVFFHVCVWHAHPACEEKLMRTLLTTFGRAAQAERSDWYALFSVPDLNTGRFEEH